MSDWLSRLDRRVLGPPGPIDAERWRRSAHYWRRRVVAVGLLLLAMVLNAVVGNPVVWVLMPVGVLTVLAFEAGWWQNEHDHLTGERHWNAKRRPPGLDVDKPSG